MRHTLPLTLRDGETVRVKELTLRQLRQDLEPLWKAIMAAFDAARQASTAGEAQSAAISGVLLSMPEEMARVMAGAVDGLDAEAIMDLGGDDLLAMVGCWLDVNSGFFKRAGVIREKIAGMGASPAAATT